MSDMLYMQVEDFYSGEFSAVLLQEFTSQYDPFFIVALILFFFFTSQSFWIQEFTLKFLQGINIIKIPVFFGCLLEKH